MRPRRIASCLAVAVLLFLAIPASADIIDLYENGAQPSVTPALQFMALGDILLCEPGFQCPGFVQGSINPADPMWSDLVRFANVPALGGYVAILYSEGQIPSFVYGPNDIAQMIADGFAQPGDFMGDNSGLVIAETFPFTTYAGYRIWSDESDVPEPATLLLLGTGLLGVGKALRKRLS